MVGTDSQPLTLSRKCWANFTYRLPKSEFDGRWSCVSLYIGHPMVVWGPIVLAIYHCLGNATLPKVKPIQQKAWAMYLLKKNDLKLTCFWNSFSCLNCDNGISNVRAGRSNDYHARERDTRKARSVAKLIAVDINFASLLTVASQSMLKSTYELKFLLTHVIIKQHVEAGSNRLSSQVLRSSEYWEYDVLTRSKGKDHPPSVAAKPSLGDKECAWGIGLNPGKIQTPRAGKTSGLQLSKPVSYVPWMVILVLLIFSVGLGCGAPPFVGPILRTYTS